MLRWEERHFPLNNKLVANFPPNCYSEKVLSGFLDNALSGKDGLNTPDLIL